MTAAMRAVPPPHAWPKGWRPPVVTTSLADTVDWPLTILVAMSFLVHFGFVGALYSDWTDPIVDESVVVQGLVDMSRPLPAAPVEDPETPRPSPNATTTAATRATSPTPGPSTRSAANARPVRDPTAGLVEAAERMRLDVLATTGAGSAVDDALRRSNIPAISLDHVDAPLTGDRELTLHTTGPIDPGARRTDLSTVVTETHKEANDHVAVRDTPGPQYSVDARPLPGPTHVSNAERTILGLRAGFRRCYEQGLAKDPQMSGDVTIRARLRATGEVDSATITGQNGLSAEVASCIQRKIATAEFDKPEGGTATIDIPVKFVRQR